MAMLAPTKVFYGFSTLDTNSKQQSFADIALIQRDLYNHFNTLPGERVMMPTYGCNIWNMLFEPFDDATVQAVIAEATRVIHTDSRVVLENMQVTEFAQGIMVQMTVVYQPYGVIDTFSVQFDQRAISIDTVG